MNNGIFFALISIAYIFHVHMNIYIYTTYNYRILVGRVIKAYANSYQGLRYHTKCLNSNIVFPIVKNSRVLLH